MDERLKAEFGDIDTSTSDTDGGKRLNLTSLGERLGVAARMLLFHKEAAGSGKDRRPTAGLGSVLSQLAVGSRSRFGLSLSKQARGDHVSRYVSDRDFACFGGKDDKQVNFAWEKSQMSCAEYPSV